jgi:hypothetical protein
MPPIFAPDRSCLERLVESGVEDAREVGGGNDERVAVAVPPTLEDMPDEADAEADVLGCCKQLLSDEEESRSEKKTDRVIGYTCSFGERYNKTIAFRTAAS